MTQLEMLIISNFIEWYETPKTNKKRIEYIEKIGASLLYQWQTEKGWDDAKVEQEYGKLVLSVLFE